MEQTTQERRDALGLDRPGRYWLAAVGVSASLALWGAWAYSVQLREGLVATGLRTIGQGGAAWGLYVAFDIYFVGVSFAGISAAALVRLFPLPELRPLTRMAEFLTIIALLMGGMTIMADLGRPLHGLLYLPLYARPSSPFFGTFTLVVAGYLFASLVYFFLAGRACAATCASVPSRWRWLHRLWGSGFRGTHAEAARHRVVSFWLSLLILPLLVVAHSTLGFVFGIVAGRPGWFSALQAPSFVVLAGASGLAMLTLIAASARKLMHLEDVIEAAAFRTLGNFQCVLTLAYLYLMGVEELTAGYAAPTAERALEHSLVSGSYAWMFWSTVGTLALGFGLLLWRFLSRTTRIGWYVAAAAVINVGAILKRLLIVVPSQTDGMLLPYAKGHYVPNWVELSVVAGLFGLASLAFLLFAKIFPIVPLAHPEDGAPDEAPESETRRTWIAGATLAVGLTLAIVGFAGSAGVGAEVYQDPVLPYSPLIFIAGIMLSFCTAIVYEVLPAKRPDGGS